MATLGNTSVDQHARATDFIDQIVSQVQRLIEGGHAYELPDGWYFDISSFPEYGKLAHRTELAREDSVSRVDENPLKKNPGDFALWKRRKEGEPYWDTPLGEGRPGWHIEDTAITEALLGAQYEIHGGAVDLIFPHHEAEIAQMESISGRAPLAKYWMHTGFLTLSKEKMSKSLGNFFTIRELRRARRPARPAVLLPQPPLPLARRLRPRDARRGRGGAEADRELLAAAAGRTTASDVAPEVEAAREAFLARLDDDFDTPAALAVLYDFIRDQNRAEQPAAGLAAR